MGRARRRECRAGGRAFSGRREVMGRAWRQECCARGRVLSRRREVMGRAWRRECRARGCAFSLRGTAGQRPRKPGTRGAAWSSSETLRAEMRCLSQTRPVSTPGQTFSVCQQNPPHRARRGLPRRHATRRCGIYPGTASHRARVDIFRLSLNRTRRGLYRGLPGGFIGGFTGGFPEGFPEGFTGALPELYRRLSRGTFPRAFPGALRAEMRRLSQTRPVNSRTDVLRLSPHRHHAGMRRLADHIDFSDAGSAGHRVKPREVL